MRPLALPPEVRSRGWNGFNPSEVRVPSSVSSVFAAADLVPAGVVRWGELINSDEPGIYVVSSVDDVDADSHDLRPAPIDENAVAGLLDMRPELVLDGIRPTSVQLVGRLA